MSTAKKDYEKIKASQKKNYKNDMQIPKIEKIVINRGLGEAISNTKAIETSLDVLLAITGQKPVATRAKKSVSNFKIRENQIIGAKVTLRSKKMYDFLTKLLKVVLPKIRDFRGLPRNSFDGRGNYTFGIKEDSIFPEVNFDLDKARGMDITIVTSTESDKEAYVLLEAFGMPFRKN